MARRGSSGIGDNLVTLGLAAVIYIAINDYTVRRTGMTPYQRIKQQLRNVTPDMPSNGKPGTGGYTPPVPGGSAPVPVPLPPNNPNLQAQATAWQYERCAAGQDPNDWQAFRTHEIAIGAPDPGQYVTPGLGWGVICGGGSYY